MADPARESALEQFDFAPLDSGYCVDVEEVDGRGMIDLRGHTSDRTFMAAVKEVLGTALPKQPRTSATAGDTSVLWLSVDQWLITLPVAEKDRVLAELSEKTADRLALGCDVTDARAIIRVTGETVRETLMKGTSVDLTDPQYETGTVRRLTFGEIAALVHIVDTSPDCFDLYVFRSYADHAWNWLKATAVDAAAVRLWTSQDTPAV